MIVTKYSVQKMSEIGVTLTILPNLCKYIVCNWCDHINCNQTLHLKKISIIIVHKVLHNEKV